MIKHQPRESRLSLTGRTSSRWSPVASCNGLAVSSRVIFTEDTAMAYGQKTPPMR
jgi:hypothetical protein